MMLGIIFHFDHKSNFDAAARRFLFQCYDYTCRAYGVDKVVVVDPFETSGQKAYKTVKKMTEALSLFGSMPPVFVHLSAEKSLDEFNHPFSAVYIVGPDRSGMKIPDNDLSVRIEYPNDKILLWASIALGIVLYDRSTKLGV